MTGPIVISESYIQGKIVEWANLMSRVVPSLRWLFAVPNGGYHLPGRTAARLKREGLKDGISDLLWPEHSASGKYIGLAIECKRPGKINDTSKAQREFQEWLAERGWKCVVVDSIVDGIDAIKKHAGIR